MKTGVIVPSYNQGKYLEKALVSIIENKKNADIDIAVMDGGSDDGSVEIIRKYEDYLTVWKSEKDGGQAAAINKGIELLKDCDYYMWLNSDDVYESDVAVRNITSFAYMSKYDVCYGMSHFIDQEGSIIGEYPTEPYNINNLGKRCYLSQPSVLFSRKAYEKVGPLNEKLKMCLDYEYWIRLAQDFSFGYYEEYIGSTRMYGETKTSTFKITHLNEGIMILNKYFGKVPMQWIVAKFLEENDNAINRMIPVRVMELFLLGQRKKIVNKAIEELDC